MPCVKLTLVPQNPEITGGNPGDLPQLQVLIGADFWQKALDFIVCMAGHSTEILAFFNAVLSCARQQRPIHR